VYAHSVMQRQCGLGYTSEWADKNFGTAERKNAFFERVGVALQPDREDNLAQLGDDALPDDVLKTIGA